MEERGIEGERYTQRKGKRGWETSFVIVFASYVTLNERVKREKTEIFL